MNNQKQFVHFLLLLTSINAQSPILFYSAFTSNIFTSNEGWEIMNNQSGNIYSDCGGIRLLGGYNLFGIRVSVMKSIQLPPHYKVQVKFRFWKIDAWDDEYFYLYLDEKQVKTIQFQRYGTSQCGQMYGDEFKDIDISIPHKYSPLLIYITTSLDQTPDDESWGIRDFYLYLYLCPPGCLTCEENDQIIQCIPWILLNSAFLSTTQSQFSYDGWFINNSFQQTSLCGGNFLCQLLDIPLFGGYEITGQNSIIQTTINLPVHQLLKIQIEVAFIDSWHNEYIYIDVDNQRIISQKYISRIGFGIENICGDSTYADSRQNFEFDLTHSQSQITIQIYTNLNEGTSNESFGIRDFSLFSYNQLCGNEIIEDNEQCDDGNLEPFDGCFMCQYSCNDGCSYCLSGECLKTLENQQISEASSSQLNYSKCDNDNLVQFDGCFNNQHSCPEYCSTCVKGECLVCYKQLWMLYQSQCFPECLKGYQDDIAIINQELHQFQNQDCFNCFCMIQQTYSQQCTLNCNYNLKCAECNLKCNEYCQDCQNGICKNCIYAYQLNNNKCLPICGDGLIAEDFEQCDDMNDIPYDGCYECQYQCDINCLNCLNGVCQDECKLGYQQMNNECVEICGDGIIAGQEECENFVNEIQNCQDCKFICPQNCFQCEKGICKICHDSFSLNKILNICQNFDFDGCYDLCNDQLNNLCKQCKLASQPYIILTYISQLNNQQNILLSFSQDIKLQSDTQLINHLKLYIIEDVDSNNYYINVIIIEDATKNQVSNAQYQIQINFNASLNEFHYLVVELENTILNEQNLELISQKEQIILLPYIQPSNNLITKSNQLKTTNQVLFGSVGIFAIFALFLGQQSVFLSILQMLQFQSYLKFINIYFPFNISKYFEANEIFQTSYILDFLNLEKFTLLLTFYKFQISFDKFQFYEINSDLLSNLQVQIYQFICLIIALIVVNILQKFLHYILKFSNNTNLRFLKLLFFIQKFAFRFIKGYNKESLVILLRANSWDLLFVSVLQISSAKDISSRKQIQDFIGYLIIFGYIYLGLVQLISNKQFHKSSKQFWRSKHESIIIVQQLFFVIILVQLQYNQILQILLLSIVQLIYLVYLFTVQPYQNKFELFNSIQMEASILIFTFISVGYCEMFKSFIDYDMQITLGWCQISLLLSVLATRLIIEINEYQIIKKIRNLCQSQNKNAIQYPYPVDNKI